jgi:hypothetical protein
MSTTTESEIFACMSDNLKIAAEKCRYLAFHNRRGWHYNEFRQSLKLIEGCCRQIFYWRNYDSRWLVLGKLCNFAHHKAGDWLRNSPTTAMRKLAQPEFEMLGNKLEQMRADVDRLRHMATGKRDAPIIPEVLPLSRESGRPIQVVMPGFAKRDSGLIVPV